jgi:hypothetical protein
MAAPIATQCKNNTSSTLLFYPRLHTFTSWVIAGTSKVSWWKW